MRRIKTIVVGNTIFVLSVLVIFVFCIPVDVSSDSRESDDDGCFSANDCDGDGRPNYDRYGYNEDLDDDDPNVGTAIDEAVKEALSNYP